MGTLSAPVEADEDIRQRQRSVGFIKSGYQEWTLPLRVANLTGVADDCDPRNKGVVGAGHKRVIFTMITKSPPLSTSSRCKGIPRSSVVHEDEELSENVSILMWTLKNLPSTTILKAGLEASRRKKEKMKEKVYKRP
jgi:hypothetical protein